MTYNLSDYLALTNNQRELFFNFLKKASEETTQPAHGNMWSEDWRNNLSTVPYLLENTDRFTNRGKFSIAFDGDNVVGCSGVYTSAFCSDLALAGSRTWIAPEYRNLSIAREVFLPIEKEWAIQHNFKAIAICFNEYNKNIIKIWHRKRLGEKRTPRQPHHLFYNGVNEVPFPITIQHTKQWLIYEKLDASWEFDWEKVKYD